MIKFIQRWKKELKVNDTIEREGTANKWTKCEEGLPDSDRDVQILYFGYQINDPYSRPRGSSIEVTKGSFHPGVGWKFSGHGVIIAWRDFDPEIRDMLTSLNFANEYQHLL